MVDDIRTRGVASRPVTAGFWMQVLAVGLVTLGVRLAYVQPTMHFDEGYHILAARSLNSDRTLRLAPESPVPYDRAWLYTRAVAASFEAFGESLFTARLPSLVSAVLLGCCLFYWVCRRAGPIAGWVSAGMYIFAADQINYAALSRFYMPQALLIFIAAIAVYHAVRPDAKRWSQAAAAPIGLAALALAYHLQLTTLVSAAALAVWAAAVVLGRYVVAGGPTGRPARIGVAAGVVAALGGAAAGAWAAGVLDPYWAKYRYVAEWAVEASDDRGFYLRDLWRGWGPFALAWPVAAVIALRQFWRPASLCVSVFVMVVAIQSCGGMKESRYLAPAIPLFLATWGFAAAAVIPAVHRRLGRVAGRVLPSDGARTSAVAAAWVAAWVAAGLVVLAAGYKTRNFYVSGVVLRTQGQVEWHPYREADYAAAASALGPLLGDDGRVLLASEPPPVTYFLRRPDIALSDSLIEGREQWDLHPAIGLPAISSVEAVRRVMAEHDRGLILVDDLRWRAPWSVPDETADYIEAHTTAIDLPERTEIKAFKWGSDA